jgi:hypothetical protein
MKKSIKQARGKHFYSHLIETSMISLELGELDLAKDERMHLLQLAENNIHHAILDAILSELSEEDKKTFLNHLSKDDHDKVWDHLSKKIEKIEDKIKSAAESIKKELHKDIKEMKGK